MTDEPVLPPEPPVDDAETMAAELALGLLQGAEHATAMRRVLSDPAFARAVERWRAHFAMLVDEVPAVEPPPAVLARLEAAIGGASTAPANDNDAARIRRSLRIWQGSAGAAGLVAAALVGVLLLRAPPAPPPGVAPVIVTHAAPALIASIEPTDKTQPVAAVYYPERAELKLAAATLADDRHSAELWLIAADGVPHSLGIMPPGRPRIVSIDAANARRFIGGSKLVVTREQPGGSPDGTPKGPAIAAGSLLSI